jgi:uncharacterized phage-associated protein
MAKALFYTDFLAYTEEGAALTAARYEHWQFGPFPPVLYEVEKQLIQAGLADELREGGEGEEAKLIVTREPETPHIEAWQKNLVDKKIQELAPLTAKQISDDSHRHPGWELTAEGEEIPYAAALIPVKPSPEAMKIAARRFERST